MERPRPVHRVWSAHRLALTTDVGRSFRVRLTALASVELMLLGVGLTYSRGALLALVCGLAVGVGLSGARLRLLTWLALAALATVPQQPEPAAVRRLSEPIGVVEGGGRGVQRQTDLGLGGGLIPGPPPALPPQLSLSVQQPHSVPLQMLAETGIIGTLLLLGGYGLLTAAGVRTVPRQTRTQRLLAAAFLACIVVYGVHALYDWAWDTPGVTLPAVIFAGVLLGPGSASSAGLGRTSKGPASSQSYALAGRWAAYGSGARILALVVVTGVVCTVAVSAVLPSVAAGRASAALLAASGSTGSALRQARSDATLATRLDPLSDFGLLASATIALQSGQYQQAHSYVLQAIGREPNDVQAWQRRFEVEFGLRSDREAYDAIQRVVALDPNGLESKILSGWAELLLTPPSGSATSRPSPAPAG